MDALAGRTVWNATALAGADTSASMLRDRLELAGEGVAVGTLEVSTNDPLRNLAERVDAMLAQAVRERGAHAVWHVRVGPVTSEPMAREARAFLKRFTDSLDAYVTTSAHTVGHGVPAARITALMPAPDAVAAKDLPGEQLPAASEPYPRVESSRYAPVGWCCLLADVVLEDRDERVGGRLHARPDVAAR